MKFRNLARAAAGMVFLAAGAFAQITTIEGDRQRSTTANRRKGRSQDHPHGYQGQLQDQDEQEGPLPVHGPADGHIQPSN